MAALVVQSRFAGLKIEDDDVSPTRESQKNKKPKTNNTAKKPEPSNKKLNKNGSKSQNSIQNPTATKKKKSKASSTVQVSSNQWEQWKQKDEQMVDGNYEDELQQAIMLSKLDFEEKKDFYKQVKKQEVIDKKQAEQLKNAGKKQKKKVMSLEQFNDMVSGNDETNNKDIEIEEETKVLDNDEEFFEKVEKESRDEYLKEKIHQRVKNRLQTPDEVMTKIQFTDALERKDKELECLKVEVSNLKDELLKVKTRNRKLCNILGQGEMKDKAEILVEVERLQGVQAELTAEVESLHTELEKERSKNGDPRSRDKKKKAGSNEKEKSQV